MQRYNKKKKVQKIIFLNRLVVKLQFNPYLLAIILMNVFDEVLNHVIASVAKQSRIRTRWIGCLREPFGGRDTRNDVLTGFVGLCQYLNI